MNIKEANTWKSPDRMSMVMAYEGKGLTDDMGSSH
jgi:hypothetical protein